MTTDRAKRYVANEREFLGLARDYLLCRLFLCGGVCPAKAGHYDLVSWQIGELDYGAEMRLLVREQSAGGRSASYLAAPTLCGADGHWCRGRGVTNVRLCR